nr:retrotransposon-related protein [Tanacetum cinerariifolium]
MVEESMDLFGIDSRWLDIRSITGQEEERSTRDLLAIDFIERLPSYQGKLVIFVIVDRLSKYAHFIAMKHPFSASTVAQAILENVYRLHWLLDLICLECFLRYMIGEKPKEWVVWLPMVEFWYNTNFNSAINTTRGIRTLVMWKQLIELCWKGRDFANGQVSSKKSSRHNAEPIAILDRKLAKVNNKVVAYVLVMWSNHTNEDATWENYGDLTQRNRDLARSYTSWKSVAPVRNRILVYPNFDDEDEEYYSLPHLLPCFQTPQPYAIINYVHHNSHNEVDIDNMTLEDYARYDLKGL